MIQRGKTSALTWIRRARTLPSLSSIRNSSLVTNVVSLPIGVMNSTSGNSSSEVLLSDLAQIHILDRLAVRTDLDVTNYTLHLPRWRGEESDDSTDSPVHKPALVVHVLDEHDLRAKLEHKVGGDDHACEDSLATLRSGGPRVAGNISSGRGVERGEAHVIGTIDFLAQREQLSWGENIWSSWNRSR
ncbi:hypothetical protein BV25DRAFT_643812 [Artomyces pyxidatus]|uniref:Uncharacterized protein n=1 Tax=Artomyces pyxidatus TaxID=48021 RepID=A0ACB8T323_9AGAM|nr:hypothetical protein BV25DRAFT_643812 [Artomyces pyxidatus]